MLFIRQENNPSQNLQRPRFHLLGLCGGFVELQFESQLLGQFPQLFFNS
jgi:hypothetical protein